MRLMSIYARKLATALFPKCGLYNAKEDLCFCRAIRPPVPRFRPYLEVLEDRLTPAIIATYNAGVFTLAVTGNTDTVTVSTPNSSTDNVQINVTGETITAAAGVSGNSYFNLSNPSVLAINTTGAPIATFAITGGAITVAAGANLNPTILNNGSSATISLVGTGNTTNTTGVTISGAVMNAGSGNITLSGTGAGVGSASSASPSRTTRLWRPRPAALLRSREAVAPLARATMTASTSASAAR